MKNSLPTNKNSEICTTKTNKESFTNKNTNMNTVKLYNGGEIVRCSILKEFVRRTKDKDETYFEIIYTDPVANYEKKARYPKFRIR